MRHRLLTSRPIIVVNLYDYEFQSLWLFVKAEKQSPNIILLYFSILGVLFLSEKNFKARRPVLDPLPPTYSSQLCFLNTSWWLLIYFQCYNLFSATILVFPESLLIGPPLSLQCVLILRVNTDILNLNINQIMSRSSLQSRASRFSPKCLYWLASQTLYSIWYLLFSQDFLFPSTCFSFFHTVYILLPE